jgi:8-oxo-dGTP pyrophosphatase MutT (NUDIX family)
MLAGEHPQGWGSRRSAGLFSCRAAEVEWWAMETDIRFVSEEKFCNGATMSVPGPDDWTITETHNAYEGFFDLVVDELRAPNAGSMTYPWVRSRSGAAVLAITDDEHAVTVRQYRHPLGTMSLELPAGLMESGESPEVAAARELQEEAGYTAFELTKMGGYNASPGLTDQAIHVYLGRGLIRVDSNPDPFEFLEIELIPVAELREMVISGEPVDAPLGFAVMAYYALNAL